MPKLIAAIYVMNYAKEYGIYPNNELNIFNENIDSVHIERQLDFEEFSKLIDLSEEEIKELNPSYKIGIVPYVEERNFYINLPINTIEYFLANKDSIYQNLERNKKKKIYHRARKW